MTSLDQLPLGNAVPPPTRPLLPAEPDRPHHQATAFALQGGGSLAAAQVGALRALTEAGVVPDLVAGSSAGALNAVAFAADPTPRGVDRLESLWLSMRRRRVARLSMHTLVGGLVGRGDALFSHQAMQEYLRATFVDTVSLNQTKLPVCVVATDLSTGEAVVISDGDAVRALLASSAFPGLYPPVNVGGRQLVDGGVAADVPILQAEALGATTTYVLPAARFDDTGSTRRGPLPVAYRALAQMLNSAVRRDTAAAKGTVHVIPAPTSRVVNPLDFRETARLMAEGYRLTLSWLETARPVPV